MRKFHKPCRRGLGFKSALSIILSICLISLGGLIPQAAFGATKTVTVNTDYYDGYRKVPIGGVTLEILQVASPDSGGYELTPEFAGTNLQISELTKEKSIKAAAIAADWAEDRNLIGWKETSTSAGKVTFRGISDGIWLIKEVARSGEAQNYEGYDPFLITVTGSDSSMSVYPKSEMTSTGEEDDPPVPDDPTTVTPSSNTPGTETPIEDTPSSGNTTTVYPTGDNSNTPITTAATNNNSNNRSSSSRSPGGFIPSTGDENGATAVLFLFLGSAGTLMVLTRRRKLN